MFNTICNPIVGEHSKETPDRSINENEDYRKLSSKLIIENSELILQKEENEKQIALLNIAKNEVEAENAAMKNLLMNAYV